MLYCTKIEKTHTLNGQPKQTFIVFDTQTTIFYKFKSVSYESDSKILSRFAQENGIRFQKGEITLCEDFKKVIQ